MSKPVINIIDSNELRAILLGTKRTAIISIVCATIPAMNVTGNPFIEGKGANKQVLIRKANKANGLINPQYDNIVCARLAKEINEERLAAGEPLLNGDDMQNAIESRFRQGESWHEPFIFDNAVTALSCNKKTPNQPDYLRFVYKATGGGEFVRSENGARVPNENVEPFLRDRSDYENQGLSEERKVRFVCWRIDSIIEIAIDGQRYRCSDNLQQYTMQARGRLLEICEEYLAGERTMSATGA